MSFSVLIVGGGGREHALAWSLAQSPTVTQIYVAPGNAGTEWNSSEGRTAASTNVAIAAEDIAALLTFAQTNHIDLTVVGPEAPLSLGIVDSFQAAGLRVFGPTQSAAQLESSKAFSKAFMGRHGIPTAEYGAFTDYEEARDFVQSFGKPVVVKADGLAAGKGVVVCSTVDEADAALQRIMHDHEFGAAGDQVIVEERLDGSELSALAFSDGHDVALMPFARDHKRVNDGDQGANTGGMGAYAHVPDLPADLTDTIRHLLTHTVRSMSNEGTPYVGVLYAGLMLTPTGVKVLEFNCRFGDPETQVILPLLDSDLAAVFLACIEGKLSEHRPQWRSGSCATVVAASPGYPASYPKGLPISGLEIQSADDTIIFHAGTARKGDQIVTSGGRVLSVSGRSDTLTDALAKAYASIERIHFDGMHYRRDIGRIHEGIKP